MCFGDAECAPPLLRGDELLIAPVNRMKVDTVPCDEGFELRVSDQLDSMSCSAKTRSERDQGRHIAPGAEGDQGYPHEASGTTIGN